ncbi:unnamed protein product [Linum trigynum]|uniref:Uncharacterized protein n=1 Tax=Linum trigynum TaxID=586398 RepID=A0AAV2GA78_9ROSI
MVHQILKYKSIMSNPPQEKVVEAEITALQKKLAIYECEQRLNFRKPMLMADCVPDAESPINNDGSRHEVEEGFSVACDIVIEINLGANEDPHLALIGANLLDADR